MHAHQPFSPPATKKQVVTRTQRHFLVLGLDGAGKTALVRALAGPEEPWFPALPTDLEIADRLANKADATDEEKAEWKRPFVPLPIDDRLLIRNKADNAPLSGGAAKVPPPVQVMLLDTCGAPAYRALWPMLLAGTPANTDVLDPEHLPVPVGVIFVISAHDGLRSSLAWTELQRLLLSTRDDAEDGPAKLPLLVAVVQVDKDPRRPRMSVADLLKAVEDSAPVPPERASNLTVMNVDLRCIDPATSGGAAYALGDLRQIGAWLLGVALA